ncbi:phage portal protein [Globicatella sanguinis]
MFDWIFRINNEQYISDWIEANDSAYENHVKEAALQTVLGKITNTASMVEFETSDRHLSYLLNVKPNHNQNATEFKRKLLEKLVLEGECLVILENRQLYIADSFIVDDTELSNRKYTDIVIGSMPFNKFYFANEVFHFKYHNKRMKLFLERINHSYGELFTRVLNIQMRERQLRLFAKFPTMMKDENAQKFKKYLSELKQQLEKESVVVAPRQDNYEIEEKSQSYVGRPIKEVQDVENMFIKTVSNILQVPPLLFTGELADVSQHNRNLINQCIKPLMNIIVTEINAKYFNRTDFDNRGKRLKLNTVPAIYTSEMEMAADVEKMIGSGVWTIDDVLDLQGKDRLNTAITTQRYLTKNIAPLNQDGSVREE